MRTKLPKLSEEQKIIVFKECLSNLDPAVALNENFIMRVKDWQKRYNSKTHYQKCKLDEVREVIGKVNDTGTKISLTLTVGYPSRWQRQETWYRYKPSKNTNIIAAYATFKDEARKSKETLENQRKQEALKAEQLEHFRNILQETRMEVSTCWGTEIKFNLKIPNCSKEVIEQLIQKIKPII